LARKLQRGPTTRQLQFAQLVATGTSQAEAYRKVFNPNLKPQIAAIRGYRTSCLPWVSWEISRIRARSEAKKLLSVNDRLEILARGAQDPDATWGERAICIREYGKLAGDLAPQRQEIFGPSGGPIPIKDESQSPLILRLAVRDRIALFKQRREAEAAALAALPPNLPNAISSPGSR
jgi:hypothetical protein